MYRRLWRRGKEKGQSIRELTRIYANKKILKTSNHKFLNPACLLSACRSPDLSGIYQGVALL